MHITLLDAEEYSRYQNMIPVIKKSWWLKTPGVQMRLWYNKWDINDYQVMFVNNYGELITYGYSVFRKLNLRPALKNDDPGTEWMPGDKFLFKNLSFTVLSKDTAVADDVLCETEFSMDTCEYEKSMAKAKLEEWFKGSPAT